MGWLTRSTGKHFLAPWLTHICHRLSFLFFLPSAAYTRLFPGEQLLSRPSAPVLALAPFRPAPKVDYLREMDNPLTTSRRAKRKRWEAEMMEQRRTRREHGTAGGGGGGDGEGASPNNGASGLSGSTAAMQQVEQYLHQHSKEERAKVYAKLEARVWTKMNATQIKKDQGRSTPCLRTRTQAHEHFAWKASAGV